MNYLSTDDFTKAFGADENEIAISCGKHLSCIDVRYKICSQEEREKIFLDVFKKCESGILSVSGSDRIDDWQKGWGEIKKEFTASGDLNTLVPKDLHPNRPMRYNGNYIIPTSPSFEHDLTNIFRLWLFRKYFAKFNTIYEFGCGTGQNLAFLAGLFSEKRFFGMDWVSESQEILKEITTRYGWCIEGRYFNFFKPDYTLKIEPDSIVYTSSALEQIGGNFKVFLDYLIMNRPRLIINVECLLECYDENELFDYAAIKYHKARGYLNGFLQELRILEKQNIVRVLTVKRTGFGSLYHEGYMYIIWEVV